MNPQQPNQSLLEGVLGTPAEQMRSDGAAAVGLELDLQRKNDNYQLSKQFKQSIKVAIPWILWFVLIVIGIIAISFVLYLFGSP